MKKVLLSSAAVIAFAGSAFAADLPSHKAPVAPPVIPLWTGFYAGLNAGYAWGTNSNTNSSLWQSGSWSPYDNTVGAFFSGTSFVGGTLGQSRQSMTQSGFIGGAQFGYNYQWGQNIVVGFETDIQGTAIRGNSTNNGIMSGSATTTTSSGYTYNGNTNGYVNTAVSAGLDYLGTARGRVGYLYSPTMLVYGTAGLAYGGAWANVTANGSTNTNIIYNGLAPSPWAYPTVTQTYTGGGNSSALLVGYSAGGGFEWMFMPSWSLKFEALYYNLGNMNVSTNAIAGSSWGQTALWGGDPYQAYAGPGVVSGNTSVNYQGVIAKAGVNYHFNFASAPVIAKF